MNSIMSKLSTAHVRKALTRLPKGVDESYDEALERIERQDEDSKTMAIQVLFWITHAVRSLRVEELQHALAVELDAADLDPEAIIHQDILISVCAGLVFIEEKSHIVRLVRTWLSVTEIFPLLISNRLYSPGLL
jgi:demethoxyubiquinone hydroxylase (CLK1/Coq7/Cat5 family)